MKTLITTLALTSTLIALPVQAEELSCEAIHDFCTIVGEAAEEIMKARQRSVPIKKVLAIYEEADFPDVHHKMMKLVIVDAYSRPHYSTESVRDRAIFNFRNSWETSCHKQALETENCQ
jgi:hypothetical protein